MRVCRLAIWDIFPDTVTIIADRVSNPSNSRLTRSLGVVRQRQRPGLRYFCDRIIHRRLYNRFWLHVSKTRPVVLFYNMCLLKNQKMTSLLVGTDHPRDAQT